MDGNLPDKATLVTLTADIVSAHVTNNDVPIESMPTLITDVYSALSNLGSHPEVEERREPAVPIRASIKPDYLVCLEDGRKLKMLKRHLMTKYNMTPEDYRQRWNLPTDYPMVSPNYAEKRRALAKEIGLGRRPGHPKRDAANIGRAVRAKRNGNER